MQIGYDAKRYFNNLSGLGNYSRDLVRIMQTHYPENNYLLYTPRRPKHLPAALNVRFPEHGLLNKLLPSYWRSKGIVADLKRDAIDLFHGLSGEIPVGLQKTGVKSVVSIHDLIFLRLPELYKPIDRFIYTKKFKYAAQQADKIVAISQQTKADLIEFFGTSPEKIDVIYQGCHPAFKQEISTEEAQRIRQKYHLPKDYILNVGSIEPRKNALQIVKAIRELDIPLVIVGKETAYWDKIKEYIAAHHLSNRVLFPKVDSMLDLAVLYKQASLFVYPSSYEGFGIPIIEALYSGTPVITSKSGVFPEAAGPSSYFIDPDNVEEMTHAITHVLSSTDKQQEMRENGRLYVQQFDDDVLAKQWMACYKSI